MPYPLRYIVTVLTVTKSNEFDHWLRRLKDLRAKVHVLTRIARMEDGNFGDYKSIGNGLYELRISYGPGYRVYYTKKDGHLILLLIGGDKSSQTRDIEKAKAIKHLYEEPT